MNYPTKQLRHNRTGQVTPDPRQFSPALHDATSRLTEVRGRAEHLLQWKRRISRKRSDNDRQVDQPTRADFTALDAIVARCAAALEHAAVPPMGDAPYLLTRLSSGMVSDFDRDLRTDLEDLIEFTHLLQADLTEPHCVPRWRVKDISRSLARMAGPCVCGKLEEVRSGALRVLGFAREVLPEFDRVGWAAGAGILNETIGSARAFLDSLPESSAAPYFGSEHFPDPWEKCCNLLESMGVRRLLDEIDSSLETSGQTDQSDRNEELHAENRMFFDGKSWSVTYRGTTVGAKNLKWMPALQLLLLNPTRKLHVRELVEVVEPRDVEHERSTETDALPDDAALETYRHALEKLRADLEAANESRDLERVETIEAQIRSFESEIRRTESRPGDRRDRLDRHKRLRQRVEKGLKTCFKQFEERLPALAEHLKQHVHTGTSVVYADPTTRWTE